MLAKQLARKLETAIKVLPFFTPTFIISVKHTSEHLNGINSSSSYFRVHRIDEKEFFSQSSIENLDEKERKKSPNLNSVPRVQVSIKMDNSLFVLIECSR
jgi:hypothetical protein